MVGKSHAKPLKNFRIQTNGILLHLHDLEALKKAGINLFTISLDSVDPDIHSELRGGSDLSKILKNIEWLKKSWEGVNIVLVTTVTTKNISGLKNLSQYALDNGINNIELRNMFHHPESKIVNHSKMHKLIVENQDFKNSCEKLVAKYGKKITFHINDAVRLSDEKKTTKA
jgi:MoaA/NifB/PqqE/SkfB family radical SAM enzyme